MTKLERLVRNMNRYLDKNEDYRYGVVKVVAGKQQSYADLIRAELTRLSRRRK